MLYNSPPGMYQNKQFQVVSLMRLLYVRKMNQKYTFHHTLSAEDKRS